MKKLQIKEFGKIIDNELHDNLEECHKSIKLYQQYDCYKDYKFKIFDAKPKFIAREKNKDAKNWGYSVRAMNAMTTNI